MDRHQQNQPPPGGPLEDLARTQGLLDTAAGWLGAPVMALSTRLGSMGCSYQNLPMFMGALGMVVIVGLAGPPAHAALAFAALAAVLVAHRVKRPFLWARGFRCTSNYSGEPCCGGDEMAAKQWKIPLLGVLVGLGFLPLSVGVGAWLIVASVCQSATAAAQRHRLALQVQAMRDARIQQQVVLQQYEREERS